MPDMEINEALRTVHFQHDQTPFELSLGWLVDFKKRHFNGRRALLQEREKGPEYTLTKLDIKGSKPTKVAKGTLRNKPFRAPARARATPPHEY